MDKDKIEKRIADLFRKRFNKARDLSIDVFDNVEVNRNLYRGYLQVDDSYEWDYALVDQQVFPLVRNYIARANPSKTQIRLEARKPEDFEKREINQDFINWEINELDLTTLIVRGFFSDFLAGKGYFKTGWLYQPKIVIKNNKVEYEMRPKINRADVKFVPFNHIIIPNRNIPNLSEQPYVFELMQLSPGQMMDDNENYGYEYWDKKYIEKLRKGGVTGKALDYEAEFVNDTDNNKDEMAFRNATFPAVCMHTKDGEVFYMPLVDGEDKIINKDRTNPYWHGHYPYIDMTAFPEDDEYYSMSVVDAVGDLQIASTEILNQTLTNVRSLNNNMWISGASAATTPDYMFKQRPSGIIRVAGDPNQIVPVRPNDAVMSMLRMGQALQTKFEQVGGISSLYSSGAQSDTINQTARGAQIIDKNIETNVQMIIDLFAEQVLKKIGDHFQELNAQFVTEEQSFMVTGKKGVKELLTVKPDDLTANFDVYTDTFAMVKQTPASRQASLQNLLTIINTQVIPAGVQVDMAPLVENLIAAYPEMENVEDIVTSVDEKGKRDCLSLERGQMPEIKIKDDHKALTQYATIWFEDNQATYKPETQKMFEDYVKKHIQFMQAEAEIAAQVQPKPPATSINFKDLPPEGQVQLAAQDNIQLQQPAAGQPGAGPAGGTVPGNEGTGQRQPYNLGQIGG